MNEQDAKSKNALLNAILGHVAFDGWSSAALDAAVAETRLTMAEARRLCPRGATDLAVAQHKAGDAALADAFACAQTEGLRYSEKVALAVEIRLGLAGDKDIVRRASALFSLPHLAAEGAGLIWGTADAIWTTLGDTSDDFNWYSKRTILAGVYGSSLLFWLGDTGNGDATKAFIDRRIANVMKFEKFKADARASKSLSPLTKAIDRLTAGMRAPDNSHRADLPGYISKENI